MTQKSEYRHKEDEIDRLVHSLGRLLEQEGIAAFKEALPVGMWADVDRMMDIRKVGAILATEIVLRTALHCEGAL
jgi:hypothetical protein